MKIIVEIQAKIPIKHKRTGKDTKSYDDIKIEIRKAELPYHIQFVILDNNSNKEVISSKLLFNAPELYRSLRLFLNNER